MQPFTSLSSLNTLATAGLTLSAAAVGGCNARAVIRETGQCITPAFFDVGPRARRDAARRLLDTSWHNPAPTAPGASGLNARVYHLGNATTQAGSPAFEDIAHQVRYAATQKPSYAFVTDPAPDEGQSLLLTGTDSTATNIFLSAYATGAAVTDTAPLASSIIDFYGYIQFPEAGTYAFNLVSAAAAAAIYLGGNGTAGSGTLLQARNDDSSITSAPGLPNPLHIDIFAVDGVAQTGWYPFEAFLYNQYGGGSGKAGLNWLVSGPVSVKFAAYAGVPRPPVPGPNPLHQYTFNKGAVADSAPADQSNGTLIGGATVVDGALVTSATSHTQAAQLGDMNFFNGSFSLGQWFTVNGRTPGYQTLFCFANDTDNYLVGHPQRGSDAKISVEYGKQGKAVLLRAPLPASGTPVKLFTTYDGTTQQVGLYINDTLVDRQTLPFVFNLAAIASSYKNVGGATPWNDPSLNGTTNQFNVYREVISLQQMVDTQPA